MSTIWRPRLIIPWQRDRNVEDRNSNMVAIERAVNDIPLQLDADNILYVMLKGTVSQVGSIVNIGPLAAWTAFVPTFSGGWALGNSTYVAAYMRIGRMIHFYAQVQLGTTATKGTNLIAALPVAGVLASIDGGVSCWFGGKTLGIANDVNSTTIQMLAINTSGTYATGSTVTATVPVTWATGDFITYGGCYEATS